MSKVLVISTQRWPLPARMALTLAKAGFIVGAISPLRSFIRRTRAVHRHYTYRPWAPAKSIICSIENWSPDFLLCTDDEAIKKLHHIYFRAANGPSIANSSKLIKLIEASLGSPEGFEISRKKSKLLPLAKSLGVRCPPTVEVSNQDIDYHLNAATYPILVKGDGSWAGKSVRIVEHARQARRAIHEFQLPPNWLASQRALFARFFPISIIQWIYSDLPAVCLQDFIDGSDANRTVVCWEGKVLTGISVRVHKTVCAFGAAALVETIDSPEMTDAASVLVKRLNLTGFIGFDFVLDSENHAWLIEMNPRATPISWLDRSNANLSATLFSKVARIGLPPQFTNVPGKLIALFPQELERSLYSEFISSGYDDVPWEEPELVLALLKSVLEVGALNRLRKRRQNRQSSIIQKLQHKQKIVPENNQIPFSQIT
jgi:hypothetical protein